MGCCISVKISRTGSFEDVSIYSRSRTKSANISKILILGTSNSGKSTLFRQMQILNTAGFSEAERKSYKKIITDNVADCISLLVNNVNSTQTMCGSDITDTIAEFQHLNFGNRWELSCSEEAKLLGLSQELWAADIMKSTFEGCRHEMECPESVAFLLDNINDIVKEDSLPTNQHILHSRLKTTGVRSLHFSYENTFVEMIDVGGQRSERRKWMHYFDDIEVLLFCASINEYDKVLKEDLCTNSLAESLTVFESIINSSWFESKAIVVFLNKIDLLQSKLMSSNIGEHHTDFNGDPLSCDDVVDFMKKKYLDCDKQTGRSIYIFTTCATDTDNISKVSRVCFDSVLNRHLAQIGLE